MPKEIIDYSTTVIYKIHCKNETVKDIHIGHTTNFAQRKYYHKLASTKLTKSGLPIYKIIKQNGGWHNWFMTELARYNCKNSHEARLKELEYRKKYHLVQSDVPLDNDVILPQNLPQKCLDNAVKMPPTDPPRNYRKIGGDIVTLTENLIGFSPLNDLTIPTHNLPILENPARRQNLEGTKWVTNGDKRGQLSQKSLYFDCACGKAYMHRQGLWRHQKICYTNSQEITVQPAGKKTASDSEIKILTNLVLDVVKQNNVLVNQNQELTNKIVDICKSGIQTNTISNSNINSNNKTFNLQFFLNETCKNAMNITDFVNSLQLQLSDLENVGKLGYVDGISSIIVKNLNALDETARPIHCTDKKRETFYIKDEDKWEKDDEEKKQIKKVISKVAFKNQKLLNTFKELHPNCNFSESKYSDQYSKLVIEAMGGAGNNDKEKEEKIIRKIAKEVTISKQHGMEIID
jgi:hypothetical protein